MFEDSFTADGPERTLMRKFERASNTMSWLRSEATSLQKEVMELHAHVQHKDKLIEALVEQNRELRKKHEQLEHA
jgi:hypothetical protein